MYNIFFKQKISQSTCYEILVPGTVIRLWERSVLSIALGTCRNKMAGKLV